MTTTIKKIAVAFYKLFRAALLTLAVVFGPFVLVLCGVLFLQKFIELRTFRGVVGVCVGACTVWLIVRRINRRDNPLDVRRPSSASGMRRIKLLASSEEFWIDLAGLVVFLIQLAILAAAIYVCCAIFDLCSGLWPAIG